MRCSAIRGRLKDGLAAETFQELSLDIKSVELKRRVPES